MKNRLYEMIVEAENNLTEAYPYTTNTFRIEEIAEHLVNQGVFVPPVKVGDYVYFIIEDIHETYVSSAHRVTEVGTRGFWTSSMPHDHPDAMDMFEPYENLGVEVFTSVYEATGALWSRKYDEAVARHSIKEDL